MYVKNKDNFIYEVKINRMEENYFILGLELVAGWDYVDRDNSDTQGYIKAENFNEDIQCDTIVCYFWEESIKDRLLEDGYTIVEKLPKIY